MNLDIIKKKVKEDLFLASYWGTKSIWEELYGYVCENSEAEGRENCARFNEHIPESKNGIGYHCAIGGDWEDPVEFVLFINSSGEVWVKIVNIAVGIGEKISEDRFIREVEMMSESPIKMGAECIGKLDEDLRGS